MERRNTSLVLVLFLALLPVTGFGAAASYESVTNIVNAMTLNPTNAPSNGNILRATVVGGNTNVFWVDDGLGPSSGGQFAVITDTNGFFLTEQLPTATNYDSVASLSLGAYLDFYFYTNGVWRPSTYPNGNVCEVRKTNDSLSHEIYLLFDTQIPGAVFEMTNGLNNSVFPYGPWTADAVNWVSFFGPTYTNYLTGLPAITPRDRTLIAQQAREALRSHVPPGNSALKGGRPLVFFTVGNNGVSAATVDITNNLSFISGNKLNAFIDVFQLDKWQNGRDANNVLLVSPTYLNGFSTIKGFADYIHSQGYYAGLHYDIGDYPAVQKGAQAGSNPFFRLDATNAVLSGIDAVILDSTVGSAVTDKKMEDLAWEFVREFNDASGFNAHPFYVMGAYNGSWHNVFHDFMPIANSYWFSDDYATDADVSRVLRASSGWRGFGKYPTLANPVAGNGLIDSAANAQRLFGWLSVGPMNLQCETNTFTASVLGVFTNVDMRAAWFDAAGSPGYPISSNATGEVWARPIGNSDLLVFMDNQTGSGATMTANWADLKFPTNHTLFCLDLYQHTNTSSVISLSTTVPANGGSLWRLSYSGVASSGVVSLATKYTVPSAASLSVNYTLVDAVGGTPVMVYSNYTTGDFLDFSAPSLAGASYTNSVTIPNLYEGDVLGFYDRSAGTGASVIINRSFLRTR